MNINMHNDFYGAEISHGKKQSDGTYVATATVYRKDTNATVGHVVGVGTTRNTADKAAAREARIYISSLSPPSN